MCRSARIDSLAVEGARKVQIGKDYTLEVGKKLIINVRMKSRSRPVTP